MSSIEEIWLPLTGFEGYYEISNHGNLKSIPRRVSVKANIAHHTRYKPGLTIKKCPNRLGYLMANLCKDGKSNPMTIHRLVARMFVKNPNAHKEVNHIDGDKTNNHYSNLEWCTRGENISHSHKLGLRSSVGSSNGNSKLSVDDVLLIRFIGNSVSYAHMGRCFGVTRAAIRDIVTYKRWATI